MPMIVRKEGTSFFVKLIAEEPGMHVDMQEIEIREGEGEGELAYEELLKKGEGTFPLT